MTQTRREFIRTFGAALAAALGAGTLPGCAPATPAMTCYATPIITTSTPIPAAQRHPAWVGVRQAWLDLPLLHDLDTLAGRRHDYVLALEELVAASEVERLVAYQLQRAFDEAVLFQRRTPEPQPTCYMVPASMTPPPEPAATRAATCYESPEVWMGQASLVEQARTLRELAEAGDLDADTVAKVERAIGQDIAFFELVAPLDQLDWGAHLTEESRLAAIYSAQNLDAPPEALKAAQILVSLLTRGEVP